jgi:hypothetical protein
MGKAELSNVLSMTELQSFQSLEKVILRGVESFLATGSALKEIRDRKLFREDFQTFEAYVKDRWGFRKSRAYQLIDAADIKADLSTMVDKNPKLSEINTERQLRELASVPADSLEKVLGKAAEIAGDEPMTSKIIKEAREQVLPEEPDDEELDWLGVPDEPEEPVFEDVEPEPEPELTGPLQCVPWFKEQLKIINELKRNLNQVKESLGNELFFSRRNTILREVEHVKGGLLAAMPHAICPRCNGKRCAQCGNMGWVNKQRYDELEVK